MSTILPGDFDRVSLLAQGHVAFQMMWAGSRLGVFDCLEQGPKTLEELRDKIGLEERPARLLFRGLSGLGLIDRVEGRYVNTSLAAYLVRANPGNWADVLEWQGQIVYTGLIDFMDSLKSNRNVGLERFPGAGNTLYQRLTAAPPLEKAFQQSMSSLSNAANKLLVDNVDLRGVRHLVDVGGGDGTNAIALVRRHPGLRVTILDLPSVVDRAQRKIAEADLSNRIDVLPGDFFSSPFPANVDAVLLSHIVTIWNPDKNIQLLRRAKEALNQDGKVIVFGVMADEEDHAPMSSALGSAYFLAIATGEGALYTTGEIRRFFSGAGLQLSESHVLPFDHRILIARK